MRKVYLLGRSGIHANEKFLLEGELIIGRDPQMCQLIYPGSEKKISGVHCKVQEINGNICLIDLNSTNGTYFQDGTKLEPDMPRTMTGGQGFYLGSRENFFDVLVEETETADSQKPRLSRPKTVEREVKGAYEEGRREAAPRKQGSTSTVIMAVLLVIVIAVAGVVGYNYYQEANKSTFDRIVDDVTGGDNVIDGVFNLFR